MSEYWTILSFLAIAFHLFIVIKCYDKISFNKLNLNLVNVIVFVILSILVFLVNFYIPNFYRWIFVFLSLTISFKILFREKIYVTFLKTLIFYILIILVDFLISAVIMLIPFDFEIDNEKITIVKITSTVIHSILLCLLFFIKKFVVFLSKLYDLLISIRNLMLQFLILIIVLSFSLIAYIHAVEPSFKTYFFAIPLIIFFLILCIVMIYQYFKNKNSEEEQKVLLELMNEYENILEKDRENRHEMLNNLVVLKSFEKKNTKEYEDLLDSIISDYENKKSGNYTNLYKLPSGVKGIVYYKMSNIVNKNINFNTLISNDAFNKLENLDIKIYYKINKILGILLDNAIEACSLSNEKLLLIDIYEEENCIFIYIENTFKGNVDIENISKKGVSSKGKNRGYGLYIVNKIVKDANNLEFEQYIYKDKFVSILKIKL